MISRNVKLDWCESALACGKDLSIDQCLNLTNLFGSQCCKVSKVKAANGVGNVRACLLNVCAEHSAKSRLKKVSCCVISLCSLSYLFVVYGNSLIAYLDAVADKCTLVKVCAVGVFCCVCNFKNAFADSDNAHVTDLTAAFNAFMDKLIADGTLEALAQKYNLTLAD